MKHFVFEIFVPFHIPALVKVSDHVFEKLFDMSQQPQEYKYTICVFSVYDEVNRNSIKIGLFAQLIFGKAIAKHCHFIVF